MPRLPILGAIRLSNLNSHPTTRGPHCRARNPDDKASLLLKLLQYGPRARLLPLAPPMHHRRCFRKLLVISSRPGPLSQALLEAEPFYALQGPVLMSLHPCAWVPLHGVLLSACFPRAESIRHAPLIGRVAKLDRQVQHRHRGSTATENRRGSSFAA